MLLELHWLPVEYRVKFKILLQTFKVVNGYSLSYLTSLLSKYVPSRVLRSSNADLLSIPRTLSEFGDRKFSVNGPRFWNALPQYIKDAGNVSQFKKLLKTFFFTHAFLS